MICSKMKTFVGMVLIRTIQIVEPLRPPNHYTRTEFDATKKHENIQENAVKNSPPKTLGKNVDRNNPATYEKKSLNI
jgi:hypothetical protein